MLSLYKDFLFTKRYIIVKDDAVQAGNDERITLLTYLADTYGILIEKGEELISLDVLRTISDNLRLSIPEPFYRNFPQSVRLSTSAERLFDQLVHYTITYGFGKFDEAGHSLLEQEIERTILSEETEPSHYSIITEKEGYELLEKYVANLLLSSRPLSEEQYLLAKGWLIEHSDSDFEIGSKSTIIRLLGDTENVSLVKKLSLADILKVVEYLVYKKNPSASVDMKALRLSNSDRKFITNLLDIKLANVRYADIQECSERKKIWKGLLYHIHYKPKTLESKDFCDIIFGKTNVSVLSDIEGCMRRNNVVNAVTMAAAGKGNTFVIRNLNYFVSRCKNTAELTSVLDAAFSSKSNPIVLMQLLSSYNSDSNIIGKNTLRKFTFVKNNIMKSHTETLKEVSRRRSYISDRDKQFILKYIERALEKTYHNTLGKVYIDSNLEKYTLPIFMAAGNSGVGVLPAGSRISIEDTNIRAFTYWEKVNDIDLSCFLINNDLSQFEFSWRTFGSRDVNGITFSGDQTSGYNGGSEFFDIDLNAIKALYPKGRYIVFCNNVYSGVNFDTCICKAGFMLRKDLDAGNVYEPKTVKSSFLINAPCQMAYLFAIDLLKSEFIWLNVKAEARCGRVAGENDVQSIMKYITAGETLSYKWFFTAAATDIVDKIEDADIIVSDTVTEITENQKLIRGCDYEELLKLIAQ